MYVGRRGLCFADMQCVLPGLSSSGKIILLQDNWKIILLRYLISELLKNCRQFVNCRVTRHECYRLRGISLRLATVNKEHSDTTWWSQAGSNRRPPACKAGALPAELWPLNKHEAEVLMCDGHIDTRPTLVWWVWEESNFRPHPYQGCALTN